MIGTIPQEKCHDACGLTGLINRDGRRVGGATIATSIAVLRDRSNGLGGGFAAYGIYPDFKGAYALHVMVQFEEARSEVERFLRNAFEVILQHDFHSGTERSSNLIDQPATQYKTQRMPFNFILTAEPNNQRMVHIYQQAF